MFDLNDKKFGGTVIFNNGQGGVVKNVELSVEKRKPEEPETYPIYKVILTDEAGATMNQGFYYPTADPNKSADQNEAYIRREVGRVVSIAKAVMGKDYVFPEVKSAQDAFDVLFKLIHANASSKKYNVVVNYGTEGFPKRFLTLRYFNFIEDANTSFSTLKVNTNDLVERPTADSPKEDDELSSTSTSLESWS